jgi:hypothetical protein
MYSKFIAEECDKHDSEWTVSDNFQIGYASDCLLTRFLACAGTNQKAVAGYGKIGVSLSRHDIAEFYVREIEGKEWVRKAPALSYCEILGKIYYRWANSHSIILCI